MMSDSYRNMCGRNDRRKGDIFASDPFKVQSYQFYYAEKPSYQIQHCVRPPVVEPFKTYYQNPRFGQPRDLGSKLSTDCRHRKALHDFQCVNTTPPCRIGKSALSDMYKTSQNNSASVAPQPRGSTQPTRANPPPLLRSCCKRGTHLIESRSSSIESHCTYNLSCSDNDSDAIPNANAAYTSPLAMPTMTTPNSRPEIGMKLGKRKSCSTCEINININATHSVEDLKIQIDTDSNIIKNTNINRITRDKNGSKIIKNISSSNSKSPMNVEDEKENSSEDSSSLYINKRLSKFSVNRQQQPPSIEEQKFFNYHIPFQLSRHLEVEINRAHLRSELAKERAAFGDQERKREREEERQRARKREEERERLREVERERDRQILKELEEERERERVLQLEFEEHLRRLKRDDRMPKRPLIGALPSPPPELNQQLEQQQSDPPRVVMSSHLRKIFSDHRLPGMAFFRASPRDIGGGSEEIIDQSMTTTTTEVIPNEVVVINRSVEKPQNITTTTKLSTPSPPLCAHNYQLPLRSVNTTSSMPKNLPIRHFRVHNDDLSAKPKLGTDHQRPSSGGCADRKRRMRL